MKTVDLIITTYNRLAFLKLVFKCIESQNDPEHYRYIIVDAGSVDGTQEYLQEKLKNFDSSVLLMNNNHPLPWMLNECWQKALPAIEHSLAEEFIICDDDVLCYGKNFIQELRSALYEYGYDVLAPRSPNITQESLIIAKNKGNLDRNIIVRPNLIGTHYRIHKKEKVLKAIKNYFGPTRRETWFCQRIVSRGLKMGFYLPIPVFDIGGWAQSYAPKGELKHDHPQIVWAKEFLKTGWSCKYGPEKILHWDKMRGIK